MYPIKQSASLTIAMFASDTNGNGVTGLVDGGFTKRISKGGGAYGAMTVTITEMENGWYSFPLSASHSDTLGVLSLSFSHALCQRINLQYRVEARTLDDLEYFNRTGFCQAGSTINKVKLDSAASATNHIYDDSLFEIVEGTGLGQVGRRLWNYDGTTKFADIAPAFFVVPDTTTKYALKDIGRARAASEFGLVTEQIVTMASGENQFHGTVIVGGKIFVSSYTAPAKVIRFNNPSNDLSDYTVFTYASDGFHDNSLSITYSDVTRKLYVTFAHASRTTISEIDPVTLASPTDVISDTSTPFGQNTAIALGNYLYIATGPSGTPGKVWKYNLPGFTLADSVTLSAGLENPHGISTDGTAIFITGAYATATNGGWVAKFIPSQFPVYTSNIFSTSGHDYPSDQHALLNGYLFVAMEFSTDDMVKINIADLTDVTFLKPGIGSGSLYGGGGAGMGWVWGCATDSPGKITLTHPDTNTSRVFNLPTNENHPHDVMTDNVHVFVTFWSSPAKVARVTVAGAPQAMEKKSELIPGAITAAVVNADTDVYSAKIWLTDDDTGTSDRYSVAWYKNGQLVTTGITTPLIQVYKIADGTDLIASTAMTQIGSKGTYRYVEATNRIVNGVGYMIQADATIGGKNRTSVQPFGRPTS